jgi:hypothetical protein
MKFTFPYLKWKCCNPLKDKFPQYCKFMLPEWIEGKFVPNLRRLHRLKPR